MQTYPYFWFALFVLAMLGLSLALHQDMKPSTPRSDMRWAKWIIVFSLLAMFDVVMLARPWER